MFFKDIGVLFFALFIETFKGISLCKTIFLCFKEKKYYFSLISEKCLPVNYFLLMTILDCGNYLSELGSGLLLLHPAVQDEVVEHLPATGVLHHEVQGLLRLYNLQTNTGIKNEKYEFLDTFKGTVSVISTDPFIEWHV